MAQRLSDSVVKKLPAPDAGNKIEYDADVKGFGCRVTAAGTKSFVLNYYTRAGQERRFTIGKFPEWTTAAARDEAKRLKAQISVNGLDPVGGLKAERAAPTMTDLAERYLDEHASRKRTKEDDERIFKSFVLKTGLAHKKVAEVTFADMDGLHRKITKGGTPYRANRVIATLSKAFNLSIRWGWRADNPCKGIERNPEQKRTRYLSGDELERLMKALAELTDQQAANIIRLLLLTGARRGEVRAATWDQFDLKEGVWTKPGATTKQKTEHRVPLSAPARLLLSELRAEANDDATYVFPGRSGGHRDNIKDAWAEACKLAGIKSARVHDLRHTYASMLASAGFSLPMIGALLGHTQPMTTARYAHLFDDPLREATERVGAVIAPSRKAAVLKLRG